MHTDEAVYAVANGVATVADGVGAQLSAQFAWNPQGDHALQDRFIMCQLLFLFS
mgnify:FL=1